MGRSSENSKPEVHYHGFTRPDGFHPLGALAILYLDLAHILEGHPERCLNSDCPEDACRRSLGLAPFSPDELREIKVCWEDAECNALELLARAGIPPIKADSLIRAARRAFDFAWRAHDDISYFWAKEFAPISVEKLEIRERSTGESPISNAEVDHIKKFVADWSPSARKTLEKGLQENKHHIQVKLVTHDSDEQKMQALGRIRFKYKRKCDARLSLSDGDLTKRLYELQRLTLPTWEAMQDEAAGKGAVPDWNRPKRVLTFEGKVVRQYPRRLATIQFEVLDEFQKRGWPLGGVKFPIPPGGSPLKDTLRNINQGLREGTIRFIGDGSGKGIDWQRAKPVLPKKVKKSRSSTIPLKKTK